MKRALCLLLITFLVKGLSAQKYYGKDAAKLVESCQTVWLNPSRHFISYLQPADDYPVAETNHLVWLTKVLALNPNYSFLLQRKENDQIGFTHYRYRIFYRNIPIQNAVYYVHVKEGKVQSANGEYPIEEPAVSAPQIPQADAYAKAIAWLGTDSLRTNIQEQPILTYVEEKGQMLLTYRFDLYAASMPPKRSYVFVNAIDGGIARTRKRILENDVPATAYTKYNGTQTIITDRYNGSYRLYESGRGTGISTTNNGIEFTNATTVWSDSTNQLNAAYDLHYGMETTYDYYKNRFNRNGWDNLDGFISGNYLLGSSYNNAFWDGNSLTFGDGDGIDFGPFSSLDVVGHEFTHAVTQYSAGLDEVDESGALNESFSDIFGVTINFQTYPNSATFEEGLQVFINQQYARNLQMPKIHNNPDTYMGIYWDPQLEPHHNSTVQGHWYYLLVNGGSGTNDNGNNYQVTGIGFAKASAIAYRDLTVYLGPNATFQDSRDYSIQAAIDLYGACSPEAIACTEAWYAVGVGNQFANKVTANFTADNTYVCGFPATIQFNNASLNANSYLWNFGDGQSSTALNPSHTYTAAGTYTVTLTVTGTATCGIGTDTMIKARYITLAPVNNIVAAQCIPNTLLTTGYEGIINVKMGSIDNATRGSVDGYKDYTCQFRDTVTEATYVPISISVEGYYDRLGIWLDLNSDGQFTSNEMLQDTIVDFSRTLSWSIYIPKPTVYGVSLRFRIGCNNNSTSSVCGPTFFGEFEDYSVVVLPDSGAPVADFVAQLTDLTENDTTQFLDRTTGLPTSWHWYFAGGTPSTSIAQNPKVKYTTAGIYPAKLVVQNASGADSITKVDYIHVYLPNRICQDTGSTQLSGIIFDSGGPNGQYQNNENCGFLIHPPCATAINLTINNYDLEENKDSLTLINGTDVSGIIVGTLTGSSASLPPTTFHASSGTMYLNFRSNDSVVGNGFEAIWHVTTTATAAPQAKFEVLMDSANINTTLTFIDSSTNQPTTWLWSFGDGDTSSQQNPIHQYLQPGAYTVSLTVGNCLGSSTYLDTVVVMLTGMVDVANSIIINLNPNPNNGQFQLQLMGGANGAYSIAIYNIDGKQVFATVLNKNTPTLNSTVDVLGIASGVYVVVIAAPNGRLQHQKLLVK